MRQTLAKVLYRISAELIKLGSIMRAASFIVSEENTDALVGKEFEKQRQNLIDAANHE